MQEYTGVLQNLQSSQKQGKNGAYSVYTFNLDGVGKPFSNIYFKNKFRPIQGARVRITEAKGKYGNDYEGFDFAASSNSNAVQAPPQSSWGKSSDQQASIVRQFCVREGIQLLDKMLTAGAVPAKALKSSDLLLKLAGEYSQIVYNAVKDEAGFAAFTNYTGDPTEAGMVDGDLENL